ncbi:MAG: nucleotidyltransferase family protein [Gemmatimonadetes bacterium]|nr:nucleotidyltransferase family protein [Gemmatimonadota bacterium]MDA1103261.1 nucleotidyltransferase family protein [Gemmatimonadota bacterium]
MSEPLRLRIIGVVPASGSSLRMGRRKALLGLDGETFLQLVIRALADGGCESVLVVAGAGENLIADEARKCGATVLVNPDPGEGPITSLRIALDSLDDSVDGIAYLPVDHPLVRAETVRDLLDATTEAGADLTIPVVGEKRGHPTVFRRRLFAELLDPRLEGGARAVVHRHLESARLVPSEDSGAVRDIDTPEAYADAQSFVAARGGTP